MFSGVRIFYAIVHKLLPKKLSNGALIYCRSLHAIDFLEQQNKKE